VLKSVLKIMRRNWQWVGTENLFTFSD